MATLTDSKHELIAPEDGTTGIETRETSKLLSKSPSVIEITRLPTESDNESIPSTSTHSTYHIYAKHDCHKSISRIPDPAKERRSGPTIKEQKARRADKKERKASGLPTIDPDPTAFFLHRPYLAFHLPPHVLYTGNSKRGTRPAVLIHPGWCWREYKLQVGPSIGKPGVIDPRGVVAWKHNGGDKKALKADDRKLKGYKVRTWRLWGETGKEYVRAVKQNRETGKGNDPDVLEAKPREAKPTPPATADETIYLRWTSPLSLQTRRYHFNYLGLDFYWKGTGTVRESRRCGLWLRFNHLKLVAKLPLTTVKEKAPKADKEGDRLEVCLGKFTSSVASKKNGTLELFDTAILRLVEEYASSLLARDPFEDEIGEVVEDGEEEICKIALLKKSTLYQVIVATATCMIISEKEKRHTLLDLIAQAGEGGGGAGG